MKVKLLLIFLFLVSLFLRSYLMPQNLFFGPEQGIDFIAIRQIAVDHKPTLIGAKTDVSGVFHGPIYYYLAIIPFILSQGDPLQISLFFIILNSLTVFLIYYLGKIIGGKRLGIIAAVIFTVSFQAVVYPRWLSSHPLAIPLVTLFFIFFYRFINGSRIALLFTAITVGLLNQAEFLHIIFFSSMSLVLFTTNFKHFKKQNILYIFFCILIASIFTFTTYILFDLRHNFLISKNLIALSSGSSGFHNSNILEVISQIWDSIARVFKRTIFPTSSILSAILFIGSVVLLIRRIIEKDKNFTPLFIWLTIPITLLIIFRHNILDQFFVSAVPLFIILTAVLIDFIWQKHKLAGIITLTIICIVNLFVFQKNIPTNEEVFFQSTQPELRYSDQLATIDAIYKEADKKPFSFQSYTIPYWTQQGWQYLFWFHGQKKYGYEPIALNSKKLFVIIQDDPSNKPYQNNWLKNTVSKWGKPVKTFKNGIITTIKLEFDK